MRWLSNIPWPTISNALDMSMATFTVLMLGFSFSKTLEFYRESCIRLMLRFLLNPCCCLVVSDVLWWLEAYICPSMLLLMVIAILVWMIFHCLLVYLASVWGWLSTNLRSLVSSVRDRLSVWCKWLLSARYDWAWLVLCYQDQVHAMFLLSL